MSGWTVEIYYSRFSWKNLVISYSNIVQSYQVSEWRRSIMRDSEYKNFREGKKHTEVTFPYNTYLCSIPLDFSSVPVHWHEEMELIVVKKGRGIVTLDRESRVLEAGQAVIVLPGQLHSIRQCQQERMEYENIIFRLEMLLPKEGDICGPGFLEPYRDGKLLYPAWIDGSAPYHQEMATCIRRLDELSERRPEGYPLAVKGWLFQFFFLLFSGAEPTVAEEGSVKALDKVKQILSRIESDYGKPLSIEEMAGFSGFSPSHFMKFFKKHMGVPFVCYLNDYRLTMAARALAETQEDVLTVALDAGFPNVSYFNRLFKRKFQMTPLEYRKRGKKK